MRLGKLAMVAAIACGVHAGNAFGQQNTYGDIMPSSTYQTASCDCGEPVCGCEPVAGGMGACDGLCGGGCDSCCGGGGLGSCFDGLGDCCLGEPFKLFGDCGNYSAGGWFQFGYHNNDLPLFNSHDGNYNLHQAWLYAEKAADGRCGLDFGGRIDYVYGVDGPDVQAYGNTDSGFDNNWEHGSYGHALPQLFGEVAYGDLAVKAGRFFSPVGYETIAAPGNFFYSHTYTRYYTEPFTHTGVLATYRVSDDITSYAGYVFGWDSGFEDNGDAYLSGFSARLTERATLRYTSLIGRFNERPGDKPHYVLPSPERGYMNSVVLDVALTDRLQSVFQTDYLDTEDADGVTARETWSINQYLIYRINDCWAVGSRFEWYEQEGVFSPPGQEDEITAFTMGLNYRPHANVMIRPEIRWDEDHSVAGVVDLEEGRHQTTFGIDTIFAF